MGDSACLVHGFSYASAMPNESKLGNPMHALGDSVSFGRFMTESLSWEKWSTFSHKKYVEEAERYSQPGSVAQKKAFFEAHYKRIAAQKAAALLEQENAAKREADGIGENNNDNNTCEQQRVFLNSVDVKMGEAKIQDAKEDDVFEVETGKEGQNDLISGNEERNSDNQLDNLENQDRLSTSEGPKMERLLVKENSVDSEDIPSETSKKRSSFSSSNSTGQKRSSPRSLRALMNLAPIKDPEKEPILATKKTESSSRTPLRTPAKASPIKSVLSAYPAATPPSENKRMRMPTDPSAPGSKRTGPKWHILSAVCSSLRTEERSAKRKQKLEEKFNANEVQKMQLQKTSKEKAGKEFGKLGCGLCFKARRSPEFYKERETPKNQMEKTPAAQTESAMLGKSIANKKQGNVSMPPPPPPTYLAKNSASKSLSKKNALKPSKSLANTLPERNTHENASPNIQQ